LTFGKPRRRTWEISDDMHTTDIQAMKQAHKVLAEFTYEPVAVERGYAGRTLYVNLSDNTIASKPVTQQMKDILYLLKK